MRVRCGAYLYDQIRSNSKNCCSAIPPEVFSNPQLDKSACYNSKALEHYRELSNNVVQEYENHVRLCQLSDPDKENYFAGPYQPSGTVEKPFANAGHAFYDSKAFKGDEYEVAKALDKHSNHVWVRNKDRLDYGIPASDQERQLIDLLPGLHVVGQEDRLGNRSHREIHPHGKGQNQADDRAPSP